MPHIKNQAAPAERGSITLIALMLAALAGPVRAEEISFETDVAPVLNQYCVMCHVEGGAQGGLSLYPDAWSLLVNVPSVQSPLMQVKPGEPENSYLYVKLTGTGESVGGFGQQMPIQQPPLTQDQIETIRLWIEQGAQNN